MLKVEKPKLSPGVIYANSIKEGHQTYKKSFYAMPTIGFALAACAPCDNTSTSTSINTINVDANDIPKIADLVVNPDLAPTVITGVPGLINKIVVSGGNEPRRVIIENIEIVSIADMIGEVELVIADGDTGIKTVEIVPISDGPSFSGNLIVVGDTDTVKIDIAGSHGGEITSNGSTSFEINFLNNLINSVTTGTTAITAISANTITITTDAGAGAVTHSGVITAPAARELVISSGGDLTIDNPVFGALSNIDITTNGEFQFLSPIINANVINVSGRTGSINLGNLGSPNSESSIIFTASELPGGLIVGAIDAGENNVIINLTEMDAGGLINISSINGGDGVTIDGIWGLAVTKYP